MTEEGQADVAVPSATALTASLPTGQVGKFVGDLLRTSNEADADGAALGCEGSVTTFHHGLARYDLGQCLLQFVVDPDLMSVGPALQPSVGIVALHLTAARFAKPHLGMDVIGDLDGSILDNH